MPTRRRSGSRAKAQNRSQAHIWRTPSAGRCASQSSIARVRLGAMILGVVGGDEPRQPAVRLFLGLGFMEMIERLVGFLDGPERPLDLALGARRRPAAVRPGGHVRHDLDAEAFHHALEHRRLRDRAVVEVDRGRNALEGIASSSPPWAPWR